MTCAFDNAFEAARGTIKSIMCAGHRRDSRVAVELYVRSLAPRADRGRLHESVTRLQELAEAGTLREFSVVLSGKAIPPTPADTVTELGAYLCNRVAVFREWAASTGRTVGATFQRRSVHSTFTGDDYDAVVLPDMLLAEYEGDDLRFVAPCREDGNVVTVADRVDALEAGAPTEPTDRLPRSRAAPPPGAGGPGPGPFNGR